MLGNLRVPENISVKELSRLAEQNFCPTRKLCIVHGANRLRDEDQIIEHCSNGKVELNAVFIEWPPVPTDVKNLFSVVANDQDLVSPEDKNFVLSCACTFFGRAVESDTSCKEPVNLYQFHEAWSHLGL